MHKQGSRAERAPYLSSSVIVSSGASALLEQLGDCFERSARIGDTSGALERRKQLNGSLSLG